MKSFAFFLLLSLSQASRIENYINNIECTIDRVDEIPEDLSLESGPFVYNRGVEHLKQLQEDLSLENLLKNYADKHVGIDYPGFVASPTASWKNVTLKHYINEYLKKLENMTVYEAHGSNVSKAYLWGPTDSKLFQHDNLKGFDNYKSQFVPAESYDLYECPWWSKEYDLDYQQVVYGMGGKYTGLAFHSHRWVSNEIIYGKKLWLLYPPEKGVDTRNMTSIELLFTMIEEYVDDDTFDLPLMCILEPGELISIPNGWNHMSFNLETTVMVGCVHEGGNSQNRAYEHMGREEMESLRAGQTMQVQSDAYQKALSKFEIE